MGTADIGVSRRPLRPTLGAASGLFIVLAGWVIGLRPLTDNSFFTHLATGRIILDSGAVPSTDPYSFTAHGTSWLVQSWLASWLYATVESLGGASGLRLLMGGTAAILTALAWRLTRPAESVVARVALGAVFVAVGAGLWAERPLMLGLIALACVVLAVDGGLDPRWLVPIGWVWVNVHGSFPLGIAYVAVVAVGTRLDGRTPTQELRVLAWLAAGVALGAVGPLGPAVLVFPIELLQRQEILRNVIEWRAPTFDSLSQRMFLVQLGLSSLALVRRPSYRDGLLVAVFGAAALLGVRNLPIASMVLLPLLASAAPSFGTLRSGDRMPFATTLAAVGLAAALLFGVVRLGQRDFELRAYPIDALAYLRGHGVDLSKHRLASKDTVGNLMEMLDGPRSEVFYDDRFDMFPDAVSQAHLSLVLGGPTLPSDLARYEVEMVLWERTSGTGQRLIVDPFWRVLYSDESWLIACKHGADLGGEIGGC